MDFKLGISEYFEELKQTIDKIDREQINTVINKLLEVRERRGMIYIFGNGGSASTASHFVNDFNKGVSEDLENRFKFICLNDNVSTVLAVANDTSYDEVFKFQLKNYLEDGDIVIGISGSGNSKNIVNAIEYAKSRNIETIGLVGYNGGILKEIADYIIHIPINDMQKVEDLHMVLDHLMMKVLMNYFKGGK
jgi:D-sedoheptulose 7-phosphate isomerase